MTDAERRLWMRLRGSRLNGCKFRRQQPLGPFIVDFVCLEQRLVIEVDGGQHAASTEDAARDGWLSANNFRVLRFWNNEVLTETESVLERIFAELNHAAPSPQPLSRKGRGT
ncbi:endonuclease domain-containing protein [Polycyclovorans algicola]|uniref:endonuclease domain-containing protein n=1 Tax=Polycyclovorans algicola TaxID=616992 RepID=UPI00190F7430